jgi:hypothetical protein
MRRETYDIQQAQAAYRARPFSVYVQTRYFAGGFRFDSENEAVGYVAYQSALAIHKREASDFRATIETPRGKRDFDEQDIR